MHRFFSDARVENLFGCAGDESLISSKRSYAAVAPGPERPSEERLGRGDVSLGAKQNIDGLSLFVDGTIEQVQRPLILT